MDLVKYVRQDGLGDYTDLVTGFNDVLVSGLAATGDIISYCLIVDNGTYTGSFSGYIPFSGTVTIIGSGTVFEPDDLSSVSGIYIEPTTPNLYFQNFLIDCEDLSGYFFSAPSGFALAFNNVEFINCPWGIQNDQGSVLLSEVSSSSSGVGSFVTGSGIVEVKGSTLSNYNVALSGEFVSILDSILFDNRFAIQAMSGHATNVEGSLLYGTGILIQVPSGELYIDSSTLSSELPIYSDGSLLYIASSILHGTTKVIDGTYISGSLVQNCATYPSGWTTDPNITGQNLSVEDPLFNDSFFGDYRLKFGDSAGSPYVEYVDNPYLASGVVTVVEPAQFRISDVKGVMSLDKSLAFTYKQGSSIRFSDHNKEIAFAKMMGKRVNVNYQQIANIEFTEYNVSTVPSFSTKETEPDAFPWDWDWRTITGTDIGDHKYLIPRSVIDVERIVKTQIGDLPSDVLWNTITTKNIIAYDQLNYRGISFDPEQSDLGLSIMWILDGRNQTLIKQNAFSGEEMEKYPLLCAPLQKSYVRPSGLIYISAEGDSYRFIHQNDPNLEIIAPNVIKTPDGTYAADVPWIPTHLNNLVDMRGVLAYKGHVYITASNYYSTIQDRSVIPTGLAQGTIYWYPNNDLFYNYTRRPEDDEGPRYGVLSSGNMHPTDISVYEDGTLLVSDAYKSEIYRYKPAYDYALIQNSFDNETRVILRENYQDVNIKE